jgi:hypothetical protein
MSSKALEMGVCFHSDPAFREHGGVLLGNMEVHFFLGHLTEKIIWRNFCVDFERYVKMPCKQVSLSLSIGALLGNLESSFASTFERKEKVYLGSFLGPRGH